MSMPNTAPQGQHEPQLEMQSEMQSEVLQIKVETARREYDDEITRAKDLDSKTTPMVAATGAVFLYVAGALTAPPAQLPAFWKGVYFTLMVFTLTVLAAAEVSFLTVLWGRAFGRLALKDVVFQEWESADELREALAKAYVKLVTENTAINENKAARYKQGLFLLTAGLTLLAVLLLASSISGIAVK